MTPEESERVRPESADATAVSSRASPCAQPATELCNGVDDDCDGSVDEGDGGGPLNRSCYDGDPATLGQGLCVAGSQTCTDGAYDACLGQVTPIDETCDSSDNDCDGAVDEGVEPGERFADEDGDGFGAGLPVVTCDGPGFAATGDDCDDILDTIYPGAPETVNGRDDDCDMRIDNGTDAFDDDNDGFCEVGPCVGGLPDGDCADADDTRYPGALEALDGVDQDCDGVADNNNPATDDDMDGYCEVGPCVTGALGDGDCADADDTRYPGAPEVTNGIDDNCNGAIDDDHIWIGGDVVDPTSWRNPLNWSTSTVPSATSGVFVPASVADQPRLVQNEQIAFLYVEDGADLNTAGFAITVTGDVRAGNTISGAGTLRMTGGCGDARRHRPQPGGPGRHRSTGRRFPRDRERSHYQRRQPAGQRTQPHRRR